MIGRALAELSAEQGIDDLQIISLDDPNIKEIVGAEAIAGRAYHTGDGVVVIVADNRRLCKCDRDDNRRGKTH